MSEATKFVITQSENIIGKTADGKKIVSVAVTPGMAVEGAEALLTTGGVLDVTVSKIGQIVDMIPAAVQGNVLSAVYGASGNTVSVTVKKITITTDENDAASLGIDEADDADIVGATFNFIVIGV